jgi:hypothetical protein
MIYISFRFYLSISSYLVNLNTSDMITKRILYPLLLLVLILPFLFNNACKHDPVGIDQFDTVCFQTQILPIIQTSCGISGCHDGGEEFSLSSYSSIMNIVKPGNAAKSRLYKVITEVNGGNMMPPDRPLTKDQRTTIMVWIEQGANNSTCTPAIIDVNNMDTICFTQNIGPLIQSSCGKIGCHDAITHEGDYVLTNYNTLMQNPEGIIPSNPSGSKIYQVTNPASGEDIMPPSPSPALTTDQRELLRKWIANGALNSNCPWTTCDTTGTITYTVHIQPFIQNYCLGCHNASNASGGVNLSSYALVVANSALRGDTPIILGSLKHTAGFIPMPPSGILTTCQIRTMELWINNGMPEN